MQIGISFIVCSLLYLILLSVVYFRKERIKTIENGIYGWLLKLNIVGLIVELICCFTVKNMNKYPIINEIFNRTYLVYFSSFVSLITAYIYVTCKNSQKTTEEKLNKLEKIIMYIIYGTVVLLSITTPLYYHSQTNKAYSYGPAVEILIIASTIYLILDIALIIKNFKNINKRKLIPLISLVICFLVAFVIRRLDPSIILITCSFSFATCIMYFTIENPDVKMLEEVSMAKESAEKANQAKSEFLSNMSHEIRTPLNAIVGFSESLKEDNIPPESREKADDIIIASQNLLEIVNGILDISKIEANKLEIINKEYDPYEMFRELESLSRARLGDKGLDFQVNIDQTIPHVLYGDNSRVKQIILNILTNAIKYTKEGYVMFTVSSIVKENVCRLIIAVEDSGIGIKQESLSKLFSKFERLNVEKQLTIEGTGLGLAITKKLLDLMNGTIIVQSIYGKGSKFTISLDQRIVSMEQPLEKQKPKTESTIVDANGAKLLIVDDNEMNIKVAMTLLKKYHFNIDSTNSGLGCIAKLKENKYDIIFLDDMMPQMSGKETLAKLKEKPTFNTPVIALTANAISGMKEEYLATGFDDYLSKPIERPELERIIKEFIMKDNKENINTETSMATTSILEKEFKEVPVSAPKEILVIDNNVYTVKILEEILEQFNTKLTGVTTSREAISNVIETKYDLIFLDDSLVDKNYEKVMEDLKSISDFNTPVVLMSKHLESEIKDSIEKNGFKGYISKPINNIEVETTYASIVKE